MRQNLGTSPFNVQLMLLFVQRWEQAADSKARVSARERRFAGGRPHKGGLVHFKYT